MLRVIKWFIGIGLVLAIVLPLLLPGVVGILTEKHFPQSVLQMDKATDWQLELTSYDRGWFSSSAELDLTAPGGGEPSVMTLNMGHGPVSRYGIGWLSGLGSVAQGFQLDWSLGLTMNLDAMLDLSTWPQGDGQVEMTLSRRFQQLDYQLIGLSLRQGLLLEDAAGTGQWVKDQGSWAGTSILTARRLNTGNADLANATLQIELTQREELATLVLQTGSEQLRLDQDYSNWQGTLTLDRLHRPTVASIIAGISQSLKAGLPPDQLATALQNQVAFSLPLLLPHQPRIELSSVGLNAPGGQLTARGQLGFTAPPPPGYLADPSLLGQVMEARWRWQAPRDLLQAWFGSNTVTRLLEEGVAVGDAQLTSEAVFQNQALRLNGGPPQSLTQVFTAGR